jgi:thiol-disulfide isomerase/thioredoxin
MTSFRRINFFVVCLAILLASFAAIGQKPVNKRVKAPAKPAPAVTEIDTNRLVGLLKRDPPRPLLVNFWATWCDPCREEFPDLVQIDSDYRPKGLDFIAVSLDDLKDIKTEVPKFLQQMNAQMPAYLLNVPDPEPAIAAVDKQWSGSLPATFLFDAEGKVVYRRFGRITSADLRAAIEKQVGNHQ